MTGLQKIIKTIIDDAEAKASAIIEQAQKLAAEQEAVAEQEAQAMLIAKRQQGERDAHTLHVRFASLAETDQRKTALAQRRALIDDVFKAAIYLLNNRPDQEKIDFYRELLLTQKIEYGEIQLAAAEKHLLDPLIQTLGSKFIANYDPAPIAGGILVKRDDLLDNFSYDLIIRNYKPELSAEAATIMFKE